MVETMCHTSSGLSCVRCQEFKIMSQKPKTDFTAGAFGPEKKAIDQQSQSNMNMTDMYGG